MEIEYMNSDNRQVFEDIERGVCFISVGEERKLYMRVEHNESLTMSLAINAIDLATGDGYYFPDNRVVIEYGVSLVAQEVEA